MPTPRCSAAKTGCRAAWSFFGNDRVVFATDTPLAPIPVHIKALDGLNLDTAVYKKITLGNAERLLNMKLG